MRRVCIGSPSLDKQSEGENLTFRIQLPSRLLDSSTGLRAPMDLLTNAIESIQVGVEDYQVGSRPRLISAVRNVYAGILLLYKEALLRHSPEGSGEVLIKAKIATVMGSTGELKFVGHGKKTVDTQQIRERFKDLGIVTDWSALNAIASVRNDVEHYYADITKDSVRSAIASAFLIIRTFIVTELEEDPPKLVGSATWQLMLAENELYAEERRLCNEAFSVVEWTSETLRQGIPKLRCSKCGSDLMCPSDDWADLADATLACRACGTEVEAHHFVPKALDQELEWERYLAASDGADEPVGECPNCGVESYVFAEGQCALCGESAQTDCARCGQTIPASEFGSSPVCGYCDYLGSKDD